MEEIRKKSLKEVLPKKSLEAGSRKPSPIKHKIDVESISEKATKTPTNYYKQKRQDAPRVSYFVLFLVFLVLIVGGYYISAAFASVTVKITPRQIPTDISGTFEASRAPAEGIEFSVIKLEETTTKQIPASGQSKIETKATGIVTITNNFSTASQPLVAGTRLETKSGLIFRLDSSVTVPGQTKKGTKITPGSITAKITASEPGDKYNVGITSFKIVGFKGTAKYDKFTVQAKTSIGGGEQGLVNTVKPEDKASALALMQTELRDKVGKKARLQIPKDFIIWDDGVIMNFSDEIKNGTDNSASLTAKVTMIALLFNEKNLSQYFAEKQITDEPLDGIRIAKPESLTFKLLDKDKFNFEKTENIKFTLNGKTNLVWAVDMVNLKSKLSNTSIREKDQVFAGFPSVHRAEAIVRPPWVLSFPDNQDKINIKLMLNE